MSTFETMIKIAQNIPHSFLCPASPLLAKEAKAIIFRCPAWGFAPLAKKEQKANLTAQKILRRND